MKNKFLLIFSSLIIFLALSFFALNNLLVPYVVKKVISQALPSSSIYWEKLSIGLSGFELENLKLKRILKNYPEIELKNGSVKAGLSLSCVSINVEQFRFDEFELDNLSIKLDKIIPDFYPGGVLSGELKAGMLGGDIKGALRLNKDKKQYIAAFNFDIHHLELSKLLKALRASKGLQVSGFFSGDITVTAEGNKLKQISGHLDCSDGGEFIVTDTSLMDKNVTQSDAANIVVENLKNYHYDIGSIKVYNSGQDIKLEIFLNGKAGTRSFQVILHEIL